MFCSGLRQAVFFFLFLFFFCFISVVNKTIKFCWKLFNTMYGYHHCSQFFPGGVLDQSLNLISDFQVFYKQNKAYFSSSFMIVFLTEHLHAIAFNFNSSIESYRWVFFFSYLSTGPPFAIHCFVPPFYYYVFKFSQKNFATQFRFRSPVIADYINSDVNLPVNV